MHSLKAGDDVGIRGPIPTLSLLPAAYDKIIMVRLTPLLHPSLNGCDQVSTGTGIVPFLQFLSKLPSLSPQKPSPHLHLIHALPKPDREDWVTTSDILPRLERKLGSALTVDRIPPGPIGREVMESALAGSKGQGVMVLVCLPPAWVPSNQLVGCKLMSHVIDCLDLSVDR